MNSITLVIFTCENREYLLKKTYDSFKTACNYTFDRVILAIDGAVDASVITYINPDQIIYGYKRKGYVISIKNTLPHIDTPYYFWLEDDWTFNTPIEIDASVNLMEQHKQWAQLVYSKYGPLDTEFKIKPAGLHLYENIHGFSANPGINKTQYIQEGFEKLLHAERMNNSHEYGFENFLTGYFEQNSIKNILIDPVDHTDISHDGYLESTPRNWHMLTSLEKKTEKHLLTFPSPSMPRKIFMIAKLIRAIVSLAWRQLWNDEVYEFCFRIITTNIVIKKGGRSASGNHDSNR